VWYWCFFILQEHQHCSRKFEGKDCMGDLDVNRNKIQDGAEETHAFKIRITLLTIKIKPL
jgi:hypothetical protein